MTIKIECPVCRAINETSPASVSCRRCGEDLSKLYFIKGYSFKYRIYAIRFLANGKVGEGAQLSQLAVGLNKPAG